VVPIILRGATPIIVLLQQLVGKSSVRLSLRAVEVSWSHRLDSSKTISRLVSLGCSLSADRNITDLVQGKLKHPEILAGIGEEYRKSGFRRKRAFISLKRGKIRPRLLLRSN